MPGSLSTDLYFHEQLDPNATQLTAGAVSTTAVATISGTTSAGAAPTVTITDCTDRRGNFLLNPVTGGGAQAAGTVCKVRFARAYTKAPGLIMLNINNETDGNAPVACAPTLITGDGFDIVSSVLTTAKAYRVDYMIIP